MALNSLYFLLFFSMTLLFLFVANRVCSNKVIFQNIFQVGLIVLSYVFVLFYNWKYALCLAIVSVITYLSTILLTKFVRFKKIILISTVIFEILMLGYFKYFNFFMESLASLLRQRYDTINILLPLGISFYIFSSIL